MNETMFSTRKILSRELVIKIRRIKFSHDSLLFYEPFDLGWLMIRHLVLNQIEEDLT
jgi:hypothetical protein